MNGPHVWVRRTYRVLDIFFCRDFLLLVNWANDPNGSWPYTVHIAFFVALETQRCIKKLLEAIGHASSGVVNFFGWGGKLSPKQGAACTAAEGFSLVMKPKRQAGMMATTCWIVSLGKRKGHPNNIIWFKLGKCSGEH